MKSGASQGVREKDVKDKTCLICHKIGCMDWKPKTTQANYLEAESDAQNKTQ